MNVNKQKGTHPCKQYRHAEPRSHHGAAARLSVSSPQASVPDSPTHPRAQRPVVKPPAPERGLREGQAEASRPRFTPQPQVCHDSWLERVLTLKTALRF